jgi:phosphoenolpyruvate carboxykinase (GTP)
VSPAYEEINWTGLEFSSDVFAQITKIDPSDWKSELNLHKELFSQLSYHLPSELAQVQSQLATRLGAA